METVAASWSPHKVDLESGVLTRRGFFSNSPLHDSNFDIGGVRKAFAQAEEVYSLFEPLDAKPPFARLKLATPDFPEPERKAAYEWLDGLLK